MNNANVLKVYKYENIKWKLTYITYFRLNSLLYVNIINIAPESETQILRAGMFVDVAVNRLRSRKIANDVTIKMSHSVV